MGIETKNGAHFRSDAPNLQHVKDTKNEPNLDVFPIDIFTHSIQEMIINANETTGYNIDFYSGALLSAFATAIGGTNKIDIGSYSDTAILWMAIVGNSGDGKTHPIKNALKYFENTDEAEYNNYKSVLKEWNDTERTGSKPVFKSTVLKDFTIETIAPKLLHNSDLLIYRDELMGWISSMNQYNNGSDTEIYLELFNGSSITVERKTQEPILTPNSHINIIGGIQYKKLKHLSGNGRDDNGFMERLLFIYPKDVKKPAKTFKKHPDHFKELLHRTLGDLQKKNDLTFTLDRKTKFIYSNWYDASNEKYPNCSTQSKLDTYILRLLLIIDMLHKIDRSDTSTIVYESSMASAINLIEYFRNNANRVKSIIQNGYNPLENLPDNKVMCFHDLPKTFKVTDVKDVFIKNEILGGSIYSFINNKDLFTNPKYGLYEKKL